MMYLLSEKLTENEMSTISKGDNWLIPRKDIEITQMIGEGTFSVVFKGIYKKSPIAIKKLKIDDNLEEFQHEVQILKSLRHPNILLFIGVCLQDEYKLIVTEYMSGRSLERFIYREKKQYTEGIHRCTTFERKLDIVLSIVRGMVYIHGLDPPLCHRDLKPQNILLDNSCAIAKICDFGTSRWLSQNTMTGNIGTIEYMSPEVLQTKKYDTRCDVYSFGIIMYELFFEQKPYMESDEVMSIFKLGSEVIHGRRPAIPEDIIHNLSVKEKKYLELMQLCWHQEELQRPTFLELYDELYLLQSI
jgi:serine/threonine protein kinase